jgi:hypothetical protein
MAVLFSHLWQLKAVVFLHRCLILAVLLIVKKLKVSLQLGFFLRNCCMVVRVGILEERQDAGISLPYCN